MKSSYMILEYTSKTGWMVELCGPDVKLWLHQGLPDYEGSIDGLKEFNATVFQELLDKKVIKSC